MSQEKKESGPPVAKAPKKVYATPTFIKYGPVAKLTRGGPASVRADHGGNRMRP